VKAEYLHMYLRVAVTTGGATLGMNDKMRHVCIDIGSFTIVSLITDNLEVFS